MPSPRITSSATLLALLVTAAAPPIAAEGGEAPRTLVKTLKVTVLSTMLADSGFGEWGFAALVEGDGHRVLVDTGAHPDTVLRNAQELRVDLSDVKEVVLTHHHWDHVRRLMTLRRDVMKKSPSAPLCRPRGPEGLDRDRE